MANWPHRKLWVEINARVNFIKELLTQHLSNDVSEIVVSYAYPEVTVCKLPVELRLASENILEQLEQSNNDEEPNNKPSP